MPALKFFYETALPGTLSPYALYLIAPAGEPDHVEIVVTGADASSAAARRVVNRADVQAMIDAASLGGGGSSALDAADIAERDTLIAGLTESAFIFVLDASADPNVTSGAATYYYRQADTSVTMVSEAESLNVVLSWASLQGKPTSAVADIDDAVTKRHSHANLTELGKIGEDGSGDPTYDGASFVMMGSGSGW